MHELFAQVLNNRDLSKAGDLFSIPDKYIVNDISDVLIKIQEIVCAADYLANDNDQSVVEICLTRVTSTIRETSSIEYHGPALVAVLEACLKHDLRPSLRDEDPPHAKIASDIISCIFLNYSKRSVMKVAVPVGVKFLRKGNKELSRNMSSYLSLAAIQNADLLAQHIHPILDSITDGNFSLVRVLPQIYSENRKPIHEEIPSLIKILPQCESTEKLCLLQLFSLISKNKPQLLEFSIPNLCEVLKSNAVATIILQIFAEMSSHNAIPFIELISLLKRFAEQQPMMLCIIARILGAIGKLNQELAQDLLIYLVSQLPIVDHSTQPIILKEIKAITDRYPDMLGEHISEIHKYAETSSTTARLLVQQLKDDFSCNRLSGNFHPINQMSGPVTVVKVGGSKLDLCTQNTSVSHSRHSLVHGSTTTIPHKNMAGSRHSLLSHNISHTKVCGSRQSLLSNPALAVKGSKQSLHSHAHHYVRGIGGSRQSLSHSAFPGKTTAGSRQSLLSHTAIPARVVSGSRQSLGSGSSPLKLPGDSRQSLSSLVATPAKGSRISLGPANVLHTKGSRNSLGSSLAINRTMMFGPVGSRQNLHSIANRGTANVLSQSNNIINEQYAIPVNPLRENSPFKANEQIESTTASITSSNGQTEQISSPQSHQSDDTPTALHNHSQRSSSSERPTYNYTNNNHSQIFHMRDAVQHFSEKHLNKIKIYMTSITIRFPLPVKCSIEESKSKKHAKLSFSCQGRGEHCLYSHTFFTFRTKVPKIWIHLMFLALQARASAALSQQDASLNALKACWDCLKTEKSFVALVTSAFPSSKDQEAILTELRSVRYFDVFEYSAIPKQWACFLCNHPDKVLGFLHDGEPVIEGQLKEKKGRWKIFKRWRTRYFTLSGAQLSYRGSKDKNCLPIDVSQIRSVKAVSRGSRHIPKAFEIFTTDKTYVLKAKDSRNAEQWVQCLQIAVAHSHARDMRELEQSHL